MKVTTHGAGQRLAVIIPAFNEAGCIEQVVQRTVNTLTGWPQYRIVVADNGSTDGTASEAQKAGAEVISVSHRGYGAACLGAINYLEMWPSSIAFLDADGSSRPEELPRLISPLLQGEADLVLGRRPANAEMTLAQRLGTQIAVALVNKLWGSTFADMGPFRAINSPALKRLDLQDRTWGWTIEMQIRAFEVGLGVLEIPVSWESRIAGKSKISGSLVGALRAGTRILWTIARYQLASMSSQSGKPESDRSLTG